MINKAGEHKRERALSSNNKISVCWQHMSRASCAGDWFLHAITFSSSYRRAALILLARLRFIYGLIEICERAHVHP